MSNAVLIYPPVTDPTSGYHSLAYIDSYARAQGHPASDVIDANIEAFHHTFSASGVEWLTAELARTATVDDETYGGYLDPVEARAHRLRVGTPDPDGVREAVRILQDPDRFFRVPEYRRAVDAIT